MSGKSILLVEADEDQVRLAAMRTPRKHGIVDEVDEVVVGYGAKALDYLFATGTYSGRDFGVMPDFVLLDANLPKMDDLQLLKRLQEDERTELLPVILFSSSREHVVKGYKLAPNSYVTKPANFDRFSEAMQYLGWYWLNFNEAP
jgi:two-component system response regulator